MAQLLNGQTWRVKNEKSVIALAMMNVPALKKLPAGIKGKLKNKMTCRTLGEGSEVHMGGGKYNDVFFIVMGTADAEFIGSGIISVLGAGEIFSDSHRIGDAYRPTSIIASSDLLLCSVHVSDFEQILASNHHGPDTQLGLGDLITGLGGWLQNALVPNPKPQG